MLQNTANNTTLEQVQADYHELDVPGFVIPNGIRLISHEQIAGAPELHSEYIAPNLWAKIFRNGSQLFCLFYAFQLFFATKKSCVLIVNGSGYSIWLYLGLLNMIPFFRKRTMLLWDSFLEFTLGTEKRLKFFPLVRFKTRWKEAIARQSLSGYDLISVWSKKQVASHANHYRLPEQKFIFLPYKSNHSNPTYCPQDTLCSISLGRFVFAGGNSKRDYKCLVDAVRGTDIPVIISATDPAVRKEIDFLPNVIVLGAPEPAFGQLQAASLFTVVPMKHSGLRGGGETNVCNAMWHGKPPIACCSIAAEDYIIEGETGFIIPPGDSEQLRKRILELWNNPERVSEMGKKAKIHVEKYLTHEKLIRRLLRLALLLGDAKYKK